MDTLNDERELDEQASSGEGVQYRLVVFSQEALLTFPLPQRGDVVVGRDESAQVRIDHPHISRRHCALTTGAKLLLRDLGSTAGTRFRGEQLAAGEEVNLRAGDAFELGPVTALVQRVSACAAGGPARRLWTHDYFDSRLEEECARAETTHQTFAVLRLRQLKSAAPATVLDALAEVLAPADVIASWGPGEYEALLLQVDEPVATERARKLVRLLEERHTPVTVGLATWGRDGKSPDLLLSRANARVRDETSSGGAPPQVVVKDPQMEQLHALVKRIASSDISVVLMGETGVGKEVFAEAIHQQSPRAKRPFVRLNCAALTETLLESELFGHEKGSFTGATRTKLGLLESAAGGTVLLDEAGEMSPATQAKLLRVIEQREVLRVGGLEPRPIDVRFVVATHRDLDAEVRRGAFRQDLFFRLNGVSLVIPPLRERPAELDSLARAFAATAAKKMGKPEPRLSEDALEALRRYSWPGNIRELRNVIERAVLLCPGRVIEPDLLPVKKVQPVPSSQLPDEPAGSGEGWEAERRRILDALQKCGGNQTVAARLLNISRRTMLTRMDQYSIPRPRKGQG